MEDYLFLFLHCVGVLEGVLVGMDWRHIPPLVFFLEYLSHLSAFCLGGWSFESAPPGTTSGFLRFLHSERRGKGEGVVVLYIIKVADVFSTFLRPCSVSRRIFMCCSGLPVSYLRGFGRTGGVDLGWA